MVHEVADALNTTDFSGGPTTPLGQCVALAGSSSDTTICYIRPLGHANVGDVVFGPHADQNTVSAELNAVTPTLEKVTLPADAGGQVWMYVKAAVALERGEAVSLDISAVHDGTDFLAEAWTVELCPVSAVGGGGTAVVGVAQWNIPAADYGWVLVSGVGVVRSAAAISTAGDKLNVLTAAGSADTVALAGDAGFARALDTAAGANEWTPAAICCLG
jgi:hypothetical protein